MTAGWPPLTAAQGDGRSCALGGVDVLSGEGGRKRESLRYTPLSACAPPSLHVHWEGPVVILTYPCTKDIRQEDCAQVGVEVLWWSFYLVWKPSSQEFPGPSFVLSAPSPEQRDAIGCHGYQTSSYWLLERSNQFTILFSLLCEPWKNPVCQPVVSCTIFLYNVFAPVQGTKWVGRPRGPFVGWKQRRETCVAQTSHWEDKSIHFCENAITK
jgi:hypothetical protein